MPVPSLHTGLPRLVGRGGLEPEPPSVHGPAGSEARVDRTTSLDARLAAFLEAGGPREVKRSDTARCALRLVDEVGMPLVVRITTEAGLAAEALGGVIAARGDASPARPAPAGSGDGALSAG